MERVYLLAKRVAKIESQNNLLEHKLSELKHEKENQKTNQRSEHQNCQS